METAGGILTAAKKWFVNSDPLIEQQATPVDLYYAGASPYGVLDMAGNVSEVVCSKRGQQYPYQVEDEWQALYLEANLSQFFGVDPTITKDTVARRTAATTSSRVTA